VVGIADIEGAERVMGVSYTAAERNQMLGNLEGQVTSALARRKVRLDNSVPMASRFDRRLPTFRAPAPQRATGLRPTFGRISRAGATAHCWSLDKVGPICRSVEDTAMVPAALNGADLADRSSIDAPFNFDAEADISKLRLGYLPEAFGEGANEVDRAALAAARGLGIEVVEVLLPDLPYDALMNILYAEAAAAFEDLTLDGVDGALKWQDDGAWPNTFCKARFLPAVNHVQLDRLRYQVMLALDDLFADVDALIGPFMTGPMLIASNFTGHPCLHLRSGFLELPTRGMASLAAGKLTIGEPQASDRTFNVPQGISLCGRLFEESVILNLGLALEQELAVAGVCPGLSS
jgi:Asp-tRNA(Asn)/Glu-tRNA(Gln) amidotransferase A subunit family amidase